MKRIQETLQLPALKSLNESIRINQRLVSDITGGRIKDMLLSAERYRAMIEPLQITNSSIARALTEGRLSYGAVEMQRFTETSKILADFTAARMVNLERFSIPEGASVLAQYHNLKADQLLPTTRLIGLEQTTIQAAANLHKPWIDTADIVGSLINVAELGCISRAIKLPEGYNDAVSEALRLSLGDWRDAGSVNFGDLHTLADRTEIYTERGLNPDLTDFPEETFNESLDVLEIRGTPPDLVTLFGSPTPAENDRELEEGLVRNNQAQDWLQRFETQIRRFIDEHMTAAYGSDWPRSKLPNGMIDRWLDKQHKDPNRQRHSRLIAYADFTEYELIVCRSDVFKSVFRPFFGRPEHFRESMYRLALPRIEISHSRIITQDDALLFYAEIRRLMTQFLRRH